LGRVGARACVTAEALRHVLWLGGAPGSGKTTVALRLARRHGLRVYSADTRTWVHRDRALRDGNVAAARFEATPPLERARLEPAERFTLSLHRERGPMVIHDVAHLPRSPLVIAEGTVVPAELIAAGLADASHALWLAPTPELQRERMAGRGADADVAALYALMARTIAREVDDAGAPRLELDGTLDLDATVDAVEQHFAAALAAGPHAASDAERRALLREANMDVVHQVRAFHARPWASGNPEEVVRAFVCECGDTGCVASVDATVAEAAAGPLRAPGHG
jgi:AAA domain-containing protein